MYRTTIFLLASAVLILAITPVLAAVGSYINVSTIVHPQVTLDSVDVNKDGIMDSGDDFRYVDTEIYIQGNVQFWAADLTCIFNRVALTGFNADDGNTDPGDDDPMVTWGPQWYEGPELKNFAEVEITADAVAYMALTGRIQLTASRLGNVSPLGLNGQDYTMLLATIRLRVQDLAYDYNVPVTCSVSNFLNRDGKSVIRGRMLPTTYLKIYNGYKVTGKVILQGSTYANNITVDCTDVPTDATPFSVTTNVYGAFTFPATNARKFGDYGCLIYSNHLNPDKDVTTQDMEPYLSGKISFNLQTPQYQLLPVVLKSGNADRDETAGVGAQSVSFIKDINAITTNWNKYAPQPYTNGDVNGDRLVNITDLSIAAGNLNKTEDGLVFTHMVYGLATKYGDYFPDSRVWWGDPESGQVNPLVNNYYTPDYWPTVSPDGQYVAISRYDRVSKYYKLYKVSLTNFPYGAATLLTPYYNYTHHAFAPSWSPDGQRLAFICASARRIDGIAQDFDYQDWQLGIGDVCVVDANGNNLYKVDTDASINTIAWYQNNVIVYEGLATNDVCPKTLCFSDLSTGKTARVSAEFPGSSTIADPVIRGVDTSNDGIADVFYLFYLQMDETPWPNTNVKIRMAKILSYTPSLLTNNFDLDATLHGDVVQDASPLSNSVGYYNVSPTLDIVYYDYDDPAVTFYNRLYSGSGRDYVEPTAFAASHNVDGHVGNPSWDGDPTHSTTLFALRSTVEWLP